MTSSSCFLLLTNCLVLLLSLLLTATLLPPSLPLSSCSLLIPLFLPHLLASSAILNRLPAGNKVWLMSSALDRIDWLIFWNPVSFLLSLSTFYFPHSFSMFSPPSLPLFILISSTLISSIPFHMPSICHMPCRHLPALQSHLYNNSSRRFV